MWEYNCGCLVVMANDGSHKVAGLLTDRDIGMAAYCHGENLDALRVRHAMSTEIAGWGLCDAAAVAEAVALNVEMRPLALLDEGGSLIGVISPSETDCGPGDV
jgi:hypothetical protein